MTSSEMLGRISLWTSITGIVLPVILALAFLGLAGLTDRKVSTKDEEIYFILCVVLSGVLELTSLVCGIVARRTTTGKVGMAISGSSLTLMMLGVLFV